MSNDKLSQEDKVLMIGLYTDVDMNHVDSDLYIELANVLEKHKLTMDKSISTLQAIQMACIYQLVTVAKKTYNADVMDKLI